MTDVPAIRYARSGRFHIAYQDHGKGPPDMIVFKGVPNHVELQWTEPRIAALLRHLASFGRVIDFDNRGAGLSDRLEPGSHPSFEVWADDALAVLDEVGVERVTPVVIGTGAFRAMLFTASHPDRVESLVMLNGVVRVSREAPPGFAEQLEALDRSWPDFYVRRDEPAAFVAWQERYFRAGLSPGSGKTFIPRGATADFRSVVPRITVPTLQVFHERFRHTYREEIDDPVRPDAPTIEHSRVVELPGTARLGGLVFDDPDAVASEIQSFLTGSRPVVETDRVLATVLFTDIVSSTDRAVAEGDAGWRAVLDRLDDIVADELTRFRGRLIKHTGDGHLATFDGPGRAIRCACAIRDAAAGLDLHLRAGLHIGEVELRGEDIAGVAVVVARRVCDLAATGQILVSHVVPPLVAGSELSFADRGSHGLKGVPGDWVLHEVVGSDS